MKNSNASLQLINLLADGDLHSAEECSKILQASYSAINQYIKNICEWGIDVFFTPDESYCLPAPLQLLDKAKIFRSLSASQLVVLPLTNSTNQYLIERINTLVKGTACVAEYQTQGRGRYGRKWLSAFGKNLNLSLYWQLKKKTSAIYGLSLMVSIVIAEVLQCLGAKEVCVKWPNDLYLKNRKLAGILVEIISKASATLHVIIGVGINLKMRETKTSITAQNWINLQEIGIKIDRNALVIKLTSMLRQALQKFENDGFAPFAARWQALDIFLDQPVKLLIGNQEIKGISRGINSQGALLLERNGQQYIYLEGEVSLRGLLS